MRWQNEADIGGLDYDSQSGILVDRGERHAFITLQRRWGHKLYWVG